jgi:RNA polymerase sigma-70 factor (ECF subfamily)
MSEEALLLAQLRGGVPTAFAELVEQFEGPLYRFFFCDHRDHHLAQEQTAETFGQLVKSLTSQGTVCSNLRAYVFGTARHVQLRRIRARGREAMPLADAEEMSDPGPSPEAVAADREELARVLAAIEGLEEVQRNVLLLRFVEGCSIEEAAEALKIPVGTVKSHIHRGRARLTQVLAAKEHKA